MSPFAFLLIPVVIVVIGSVVLYLRQRKPTTLHSGIEEFRNEMKALSPEGGAQSRRPRRFDSDGRNRDG